MTALCIHCRCGTGVLVRSSEASPLHLRGESLHCAVLKGERILSFYRGLPCEGCILEECFSATLQLRAGLSHALKDAPPDAQRWKHRPKLVLCQKGSSMKQLYQFRVVCVCVLFVLLHIVLTRGFYSRTPLKTGHPGFSELPIEGACGATFQWGYYALFRWVYLALTGKSVRTSYFYKELHRPLGIQTRIEPGLAPATWPTSLKAFETRIVTVNSCRS